MKQNELSFFFRVNSNVKGVGSRMRWGGVRLNHSAFEGCIGTTKAESRLYILLATTKEALGGPCKRPPHLECPPKRQANFSTCSAPGVVQVPAQIKETKEYQRECRMCRKGGCSTLNTELALASQVRSSCDGPHISQK